MSVADDPAGNLRFAADLFNHGYYWEAHEVWEDEWNRAGRRGPHALLFQGLIKLAAAGVKAREGNPAGVRRHLARAIELLQSARDAWNPAEQGAVHWNWDELLALAILPFDPPLSADAEASRPERLWAQTLRWDV